MVFKGAILAPLSFVGGPIIIRAAWYVLKNLFPSLKIHLLLFHLPYLSFIRYTAGIIGGLSTVAVCAPSDRFMYMGGPLAIGLGVVFASSIGSMFLPATTALGAGLYSMSLYGGLILFSGFLLYDTQRIVHKAQTHPNYTAQKFDPINS